MMEELRSLMFLWNRRREASFQLIRSSSIHLHSYHPYPCPILSSTEIIRCIRRRLQSGSLDYISYPSITHIYHHHHHKKGRTTLSTISSSSQCSAHPRDAQLEILGVHKHHHSCRGRILDSQTDTQARSRIDAHQCRYLCYSSHHDNLHSHRASAE